MGGVECDQDDMRRRRHTPKIGRLARLREVCYDTAIRSGHLNHINITGASEPIELFA